MNFETSLDMCSDLHGEDSVAVSAFSTCSERRPSADAAATIVVAA